MRIRDIVHVSGTSLRVLLDRGDEDLLIQLSDPQASSEPVSLDPYGSELLAAFLLNARLAGGAGLAEEGSAGLFGCRFRLVRGKAVELSQHGRRLLVPDLLWDRLYAELMLAVAHARHLAMPRRYPPSPLPCARARLLH